MPGGGGQGVTERENPLRWRISLGTQWKLTKMPPPPGRRRTRSNRVGKSTAVEDFARYSVEDVQDAAAAGKEGTPLPRRGKEVAVRENTLRWRISPRYSVDCRRGGQGVAERQNPLRRGMSLGYSERSRKNRSIRRFYQYVCDNTVD